ncbi:MAG: FHA domain-containing protein, partial [Planctomycetota bacterium]
MTETNGDATDGVRLLIAVGGSPRPAVSPSAGSPTVVGRAADCDVVVADEVCSRRHCEIVFEGGDWFVRDLDSRNGTELNNRPIGRAKLRHGDVVLAGTCAITFVRPGGGGAGGEGQTAAGPMTDILERRQRSTFAADLPGDAIGPRLGEDLATLHRLTLAMGAPGPMAEVCGRVLSEVVGRVGASTGALLRSVGGPDAAAADASGLAGFELVAAVPPPLTRENLSGAVARVTLEDGDAVLARDVGDDSRLVERDSLGKLGARSVICAPLRHAGRVVGQLHLYGSEGGEFGAEQLDFALAVADQLAAALAQREEQERLSDKLDDARARHEELVASLRGDSAIVG